tara:strand:+ start:47 stop:514 length:468 start_codon:yes stop_codon:yes gene_type:complete
MAGKKKRIKAMGGKKIGKRVKARGGKKIGKRVKARSGKKIVKRVGLKDGTNKPSPTDRIAPRIAVGGFRGMLKPGTNSRAIPIGEEIIPVKVVARDTGEVDVAETRRINSNNKALADAINNESFTMGRVINYLVEKFNPESGRTIRAARKISKMK